MLPAAGLAPIGSSHGCFHQKGACRASLPCSYGKLRVLAWILGKGVRLDGPEAGANDALGTAIYQGALLCLKRAIALRVFGMDGERPVNTA